MTTSMDRMRLAAFVDGELGPEEAAAVVMHLAEHPADQAYVDDLFAANAALGRAFDAPMREPVPEAVRRVIAPVAAGGQVVPFRRRAFAVGGAVSLAASILGVAVLMGRPGPVDLALGPVAEGTALAAMLDGLPSGRVEALGQGRDMVVLATLPTPGGHCREVEVMDRAAGEIALALACREGGAGWQVAVVLKEPLAATGTETGFVAADGAEMAGLSAFLDARRAGLALTAEEEAALMARDWAQ